VKGRGKRKHQRIRLSGNNITLNPTIYDQVF
jgi:hypothetical protein